MYSELKVIEVLGKGGVLQEFIVLEPGGERTVTQFIERVN